MKRDPLKKTLNQVADIIRQKKAIKADHPLAVYQQLVFNNLNSVISPCFPVLRSLITHDQWQGLVRRFIQYYSATNYCYHQVSEHFVDFLSDQDHLPYPFLAELAHYEWLELSVDTSPLPTKTTPLTTDIDNSHFQLAPWAKFELYDYPVHTIHADHLPEQPEATALMVYRPSRHNPIEFMKLSLLSWHCLHFIIHDNHTLNTYLAAASHGEESTSKQAIESYRQFLGFLHQQAIILAK